MTIEDLEQENKSYGHLIETYKKMTMSQNSTKVKEFTECRILELEKAIAENMEKIKLIGGTK